MSFGDILRFMSFFQNESGTQTGLYMHVVVQTVSRRSLQTVHPRPRNACSSSKKFARISTIRAESLYFVQSRNMVRATRRCRRVSLALQPPPPRAAAGVGWLAEAFASLARPGNEPPSSIPHVRSAIPLASGSASRSLLLSFKLRVVAMCTLMFLLLLSALPLTKLINTCLVGSFSTCGRGRTT